jgi:PilZ domain
LEKMSMPTGRSEKRTPIELAVELSHVGKTSVKERVLTENLSSRGLRVVTKSMWPPGARVRVSFAGEEIDERARVVYCQRLANMRFAVGLELSATVKQSDD